MNEHRKQKGEVNVLCAKFFRFWFFAFFSFCIPFFWIKHIRTHDGEEEDEEIESICIGTYYITILFELYLNVYVRSKNENEVVFIFSKEKASKC